MKHVGDGAKIDTEEVTCRYADGAEEKAQPEHEDDGGQRLCMGKIAIVKFQIGEDTGLLIWAVLANIGTLILGMVNEMALSGLVSVEAREEWIDRHTSEPSFRFSKARFWILFVEGALWPPSLRATHSPMSPKRAVVVKKALAAEYGGLRRQSGG